MFHFKDGWFFERNPDGSVRVLKMSDATGQAVKVSEANIDPDAWASIVSFVSAENDNAEAWKAVKEFHMEGCLRVPAPMAEQHLTGITPPDEVVAQIDRLAQFILNEVPGEPSENEGAVDTAIRLMREFYVERAVPLPMTREAFHRFVNRALGEVSMCWDPRPTGVFNSAAVVVLGERIVDLILGPEKINPEPVPDEVFESPEVIESPPPGAELEQPAEAPPEQPEKPPEAA